MNRCAIYTRKSTEDGLEQDFNSLHAQREACEAYIKSQRHEGWKLVRTAYDDGGFSGGTMERPALQQLLAAVERHEIDIIVVYKVDRLTRSLADFSKIIERLDRQNVYFVSVTQAFNTTSSMGRLTLNVLLSFAQFEREVTAERIRDKIAASKKKGIWMGGNLPLGYDAIDRKLVVNDKEAATVRRLFDLYGKHRRVRLLKAEADRLGIITKRIIRKDGSVTGCKPLSRGNLYRLLSNPLYVGLIPHKGKTYPGQHNAIIDQETWDRVQQIMRDNSKARSSPKNVKASFLLTGLVFDEDGEPLYQAQASKKGKRYRYYISKKLVSHPKSCSNGWRLPAQTVESTVIGLILDLLQDRQRLMDLISFANSAPSFLETLKVKADELGGKLIDANIEYQQTVLQAIVQRVGLSTDTISIDLSRKALFSLLEIIEAIPTDDHDDIIPLHHAVTIQRKGVETKLVIEVATKARQPDLDLCRLIATARNWFDQLASGEVKSVKEIAEREMIFNTEITRVLPLAFLAPSIIEDIVEGRQPETLTVRSLRRVSPLPTDWNEQRKRLGFHQ